MQCFRYKEDRLPVFLITLLFLLNLTVYFTVTSVWLAITWMVMATFVQVFTAAWNHHHQHLNTFKQTLLNRLLEIVYTFHTGVTTNTWVLHHNLGHHLNYLDQTKDESGWKRKDGTKMGPFEYMMVIALTGYTRSYRVGKNYPKYQSDFIRMGFVNLAILLVLFWYNWINALIIFLIPMLGIYLGTCWTTYYHHAGLETDDDMHASHNVINKPYNIITGNLGYHTAHHYKQALHWSKLPELHESIKDKIPPELIATEFPGVGGQILRKLRAALAV